MKKIALLASLLLAGNAFAGELTNYGMLKNAALQGKRISIVIDGSKCELAPNDHDKVFYYSFMPNHVNIEPVDLDGIEKISTSANYIHTNERIPAVIINADFLITPNNKVDVSITYFDFSTRFPRYARGMECPLSSGAHIYTA